MAGHAEHGHAAADRAGARRGLDWARSRCRRGCAAACWCCRRLPNRFFTSIDGGLAVAQRTVAVVGAARQLDRRRHEERVQRREVGAAGHPAELGRRLVGRGALEQVVVDLHHDPRAGLELDAVAVAGPWSRRRRAPRRPASWRRRGSPNSPSRPVPPKQVQPGSAVAASLASAAATALRRDLEQDDVVDDVRVAGQHVAAGQPDVLVAAAGRAGSSGSRRCRCPWARTACRSPAWSASSAARRRGAAAACRASGSRPARWASTSGGSSARSSAPGSPARSALVAGVHAGRRERHDQRGRRPPRAGCRDVGRFTRAARSSGARRAGAGGCGRRSARRRRRC